MVAEFVLRSALIVVLLVAGMEARSSEGGRDGDLWCGACKGFFDEIEYIMSKSKGIEKNFLFVCVCVYVFFIIYVFLFCFVQEKLNIICIFLFLRM